MRQFLVASFFAVVIASSAASAQEDPLPQSVAQAYLAYEDALASDDYAAAGAAAERAFLSALQTDVPQSVRLVLGINALTFAGWREPSAGLLDISRATRRLARELDDPDALRDAHILGVVAARGSNDFVSFDLLYADMMVYAAEHVVSDDDRLRFARVESLRTPPAPLPDAGRLMAVLAAAREDGDAVMLANATIRLQRDALARSDWPEAYALTEMALSDLDEIGVQSPEIRAALLAGLSAALRADPDFSRTGEILLPPRTRLAWCEHRSRHPVPLDYTHQTRIPVRAVERGLRGGFVVTPFTVPAGGGPPRLGESVVNDAGSVYERASREHLAETQFLGGCDGQERPVHGVLVEGFVLEGDGPQFAGHVFHVFVEREGEG